MAHVLSAQTSVVLPTTRRQFQSCDYCRGRRRKCDAGALGIDPYSSRGSHDYRSCTSCAKFGRDCTFTWLSQRKRPRTFIEAQNVERHPIQRKRRANTTTALGRQSADISISGNASAVSASGVVAIQNYSDLPSLLDKRPTRQQDQNVSPTPTTLGNGDVSWDFSPIDWDTILGQHTGDDSEPVICGEDGHEQHQTSYSNESGTGLLVEDSSQPTIPSLPLESTTTCSPPAIRCPTRWNLADERLSTSTNSRSVTDILISIYRVNLEGVLSSWSTAFTCPYVTYSADSAASTAYSCTTFYDRAKRMDCSLSRLGLERVVSSTNSHRGMESQVLNKVILAFASQWDSTATGRPEINHDVFARTLQAVMHRTLWQDAHTALQKVAGPAGSFRIILARLIFSFINNPLDADPTLDNYSSTESHYNLNHTDWNGTAHEGVCTRIITDPDCLTQMEKALRDLLHWRRRLYARLWTIVESGSSLSIDHQTFLTDFNTLFWLSVMCDTTASAVTGRPLVIADDDCAIERIRPWSRSTLTDLPAGQPSYAKTTAAGKGSKKSIPLWKSVLTKEMNGASYLPSSYDSINPEATIKEAIPLKVLLFRHISTLQVLIDQRAAEYNIENAIQDALLVYRQWQTRYGDFMDNCVDRYNTMSHHVRSWHTILVAHWHYGVMLFAEKVQNVDRLRLGLNRQHRERHSPYHPTALALSSATRVAKLAQCCLETNCGAYLSPDQVQNRLAMLSEPWCEIMIRSLAMTAETLLRSCVSEALYHNEQNVQTHREGISACIEVLEELGACRSKSASRIAQLLKHELDCISQAA